MFRVHCVSIFFVLLFYNADGHSYATGIRALQCARPVISGTCVTHESESDASSGGKWNRSPPRSQRSSNSNMPPPHQKVTAFETSPETIAGNSGVPGSYLPPRSGIRVSYDATDIARGDATSTAVLEASI